MNKEEQRKEQLKIYQNARIRFDNISSFKRSMRIVIEKKPKHNTNDGRLGK